MKKGFTLVELSIVLVIIGLLIGGILAAQSMVGDAKLQKMVREFQQFDSAIRNFKNVYRYLPGDYPNAGATIGNGDGDGVINSYTAEPGLVWKQMEMMGYLSPSVGLAPVTPYKDVVLSVCYGSGCGGWGSGYFSSTWYDTKNAYGLAGAAGLQLMKGVDALAIDSKIDDGHPQTGLVERGQHSGCTDGGNNYDAKTSDMCYLFYFPPNVFQE